MKRWTSALACALVACVPLEAVDPADGPNNGVEGLVDASAAPDGALTRGAELVEPPALEALWSGEITPSGGGNAAGLRSSEPTVDGAVVALLVQFPGRSALALCSGVLIAPDAVLSAGHCLVDAERGSYAGAVRVVPALDTATDGGPRAPYGSTFARDVIVPPDFGAATHDLALLRLHEPIGDIAGMRVMADGASLDAPLTLVGMRRAGPGFEPAAGAGRVRARDGSMLRHDAPSAPGTSGAPLYSDDALARRVVGVHVSRDERGWAQAVALDAPTLAWIARALMR